MQPATRPRRDVRCAVRLRTRERARGQSDSAGATLPRREIWRPASRVSPLRIRQLAGPVVLMAKLIGQGDEKGHAMREPCYLSPASVPHLCVSKKVVGSVNSLLDEREALAGL
jgi:hypothetical protein